MGQAFRTTSFAKPVLSAALAGVLAFPASSATTTWQIDPAHTAAGFAVKHLMISTVRGQFKGIAGAVTWDDQDVSKSSIEVTIDANTVDTSEPNRDKDLKSEKFFDVAKYPTITFKSKKIENVSAGKLKVTGDLTIHGVTREVVLDVEGPSNPVKDPWGNTRVAASATTKVNRQDYGVKWNANIDGGGVVVGDDVNITIDLEMTKKVAK
ncbi:MAG TPA: YceI family protein [Candidatus Eisenbacteria bacterium]|jgi:polyisoprenoid-binding protein YceI|nr:YceI family protein [Candidatus Eisenbacteria bacterium]